MIRSFSRHLSARGVAGAPDLDWEDVAQEASRRFFATGFERIRDPGAIRSYLYSVVKSTYLQFVRSATRRQRREEAVEFDEAVRPDPGSRIDALAILARLGESCREILERAFLDGASYGDLAVEMGMAESSIRAKVSRCLKEAREIASREGGR